MAEVDPLQPLMWVILCLNYSKLNVNVCKEAFIQKCTNKTLHHLLILLKHKIKLAICYIMLNIKLKYYKKIFK